MAQAPGRLTPLAMPRAKAVERMALLRRQAERLRAEQIDMTTTVAEEHAQRNDYVCRRPTGKDSHLIEAGTDSQIGRTTGRARRTPRTTPPTATTTFTSTRSHTTPTRSARPRHTQPTQATSRFPPSGRSRA
jgi:hypothetical protein